MDNNPEVDADRHALAAAKDKSCKIETLRTKKEGEDLPEDLQEWLYSYIGRPPTRTSPPGYIPGTAVMERVAKRGAAREEALALGIAPPLNRKPAGYVAGAAVRRRVEERQTAREASAAEVRKIVAHRESHVDRRGDWFFRGGPTMPLKVEVVACEGAKPVSETAGMLTKAEREAVVAHVVEIIALDGVHHIWVVFCGCKNISRVEQLRQVRLYGKGPNPVEASTYEMARFWEDNLLIAGPSRGGAERG
ncbi:hypothetical protein R3P38DRAFT_3245341 [Favolaschia claudopus]|uniref:Uncharacterized protein n=1 Tax=Favolaschia claudopus TaxID=2862362 RepID=A0AAV9Z0P5_9AGAR